MRPASTPASSSSSGLPRALLQAGKLSQQQIDTIQRTASEERIPFIDAVIRGGELDANSRSTRFSEPPVKSGYRSSTPSFAVVN